MTKAEVAQLLNHLAAALVADYVVERKTRWSSEQARTAVRDALDAAYATYRVACNRYEREPQMEGPDRRPCLVCIIADTLRNEGLIDEVFVGP